MSKARFDSLCVLIDAMQLGLSIELDSFVGPLSIYATFQAAFGRLTCLAGKVTAWTNF